MIDFPTVARLLPVADIDAVGKGQTGAKKQGQWREHTCWSLNCPSENAKETVHRFPSIGIVALTYLFIFDEDALNT